ncbi:hypothetical protein ACHAW5_008405 [Stephanodiscus triporus]|uniref:PS II complex 12 kDa extrinsic protein n=1 Tax=Stephanodiscus triporus TaxID=2934178 RepID=A0ABD3QCX3_9STRA
MGLQGAAILLATFALVDFFGDANARQLYNGPEPPGPPPEPGMVWMPMPQGGDDDVDYGYDDNEEYVEPAPEPAEPKEEINTELSAAQAEQTTTDEVSGKSTLSAGAFVGMAAAAAALVAAVALFAKRRSSRESNNEIYPEEDFDFDDPMRTILKSMRDSSS